MSPKLMVLTEKKKRMQQAFEQQKLLHSEYLLNRLL
jgi:hypothetical protein